MISVIVPVYNVEKYINQCLDSIINQTYRDIEIILVDDGSTDKSGNICDEYAKKDNRIKVIHKENGGLSDARNTGLKETTGDYITIIDPDDWIDLNNLEYALDFLLKNDLDVVMWPYLKEYSNKSVKKILFYEDEIIFNEDDVKYKLLRRLIGPYGENLRNLTNYLSICSACMKLYKKSLIDKIEFVDLKKIGTYEDGLFNINVFNNCKKIGYINKYFYHYRRNEASLTHSYKENLYKQYKYLFSLIEDFINKNKLDNTFIEALNNRKIVTILELGNNLLVSNYSLIKKHKILNIWINNKEFKEIVKNFDLTKLSTEWKIFYFNVKYGLTINILIMLNIIKILVKKIKL